jgi:hypothetical protein
MEAALEGYTWPFFPIAELGGYLSSKTDQPGV